MNKRVAPQVVENDRAGHASDVEQAGRLALTEDLRGDARSYLHAVERAASKKKRVDARIAAEQSGRAAADVDVAVGAVGKVEDRAAGRPFAVFRRSDAHSWKFERDAVLDDDGLQFVLLMHGSYS